jgi:hypothetical protein
MDKEEKEIIQRMEDSFKQIDRQFSCRGEDMIG